MRSKGDGVWNKRSAPEICINGPCCAQERKFRWIRTKSSRHRRQQVATRAGSTGNHVRYVLIASTALVIVAFIAIALFVKA